jgi:hypothetical protein
MFFIVNNKLNLTFSRESRGCRGKAGLNGKKALGVNNRQKDRGNFRFYQHRDLLTCSQKAYNIYCISKD